MADKYYLDEEGLQRLVDYIRLQLKPVENNTKAIELLNKTDGSPGSIQKMIDDVIDELDIAELQQKGLLNIYGGSASEVFEEV